MNTPNKNYSMTYYFLMKYPITFKETIETCLTCIFIHVALEFQHDPTPRLAQFGCSLLAVLGHVATKLQSST